MELKKIEENVRRYYEANKELVVSILAAGVVLCTGLLYAYFPIQFDSVLGIVVLLELIFVITFLTAVAGAIVIRVLIDVGVGLTLIIFLAQSYCSSPLHTVTGNAALNTLVLFGLGYIAIDFGVKLYQGLVGFLKRLESEKWGIVKIIVVFVFLALAYLFVWELYEVVNPIVFGLCIYQ